METRTLGRTGLKISRLVFGCGAVGGVIFKSRLEESVEAVRRALDHGVNWFDTAASYGDGRSEERLGEILRELGADPHVSTKVGLAPEELGDIPGGVRRSLERSLRRLGRDRVDLFQLHNPVTTVRGARGRSLTVEDVLGKGGVAETFDRLRDERLFAHTGFTGFGETECLGKVIESEAFQTMQTYFNLLNPSALLPVPAGFGGQDFRRIGRLAREHGVGVLNIRVLAAGVLAGRELADQAGLAAGASGAEENARARRLREELGLDAGALYRAALRFAFGQDGIDGVLVGFAEPAHVDAAAAALEEPPLEPEILTRVDSLYQKPPFS